MHVQIITLMREYMYYIYSLTVIIIIFHLEENVYNKMPNGGFYYQKHKVLTNYAKSVKRIRFFFLKPNAHSIFVIFLYEFKCPLNGSR